MSGKLRDLGWRELPRQSKLAGAMYPSHLDAKMQREMVAANAEQAAGFERRIAEANRMYGKATVAPSSYDKVPGLRRTEVKATKSWWQK